MEYALTGKEIKVVVNAIAAIDSEKKSVHMDIRCCTNMIRLNIIHTYTYSLFERELI